MTELAAARTYESSGPNPETDLEAWLDWEERRLLSDYAGTTSAELNDALDQFADEYDQHRIAQGWNPEPLDEAAAEEFVRRAAALSMAVEAHLREGRTCSPAEVIAHAKGILDQAALDEEEVVREQEVRAELARLFERRAHGRASYTRFAARLRSEPVLRASMPSAMEQPRRASCRSGRPSVPRRPAHRRTRRARSSGSDGSEPDGESPARGNEEDAGGSSRAALEAALSYRSTYGFSVLPLKPRDKTPHFDVLQRVYRSPKTAWFRHEVVSETEIEHWFEVDPACNIGIVTGPASGHLAVIDVDTADARLALPDTPVALTARGRHYYLRCPAVEQTLSFPWGEVRAGGAYVVAPPSVHFDGSVYRWVPDEGIADVELPFLTGEEVNEAIEALPGAAERGADSKKVFPLASWADLPDPVDLAVWDAFEPFVCAAAALVGINAPIGQKFRCILPGHEDRNPSACLWRDERRGLVVYQDFHAGKRARPGQKPLASLTLAEVYAADRTGRVERLRGLQHVLWKLRLLVDTGFVDRPPVNAPPAPPTLTAATLRVYDGFCELVSIRQLTALRHEPAPYSWRFASGWCGVSESSAGRGMQQLLAHGLIRRAGAMPGARGAALFELGDGKREEHSREHPRDSRQFQPWGGLTNRGSATAEQVAP